MYGGTCTVRQLLLDTQYRMHPAISAWPRNQFYDERVRAVQLAWFLTTASSARAAKLASLQLASIGVRGMADAVA